MCNFSGIIFYVSFFPNCRSETALENRTDFREIAEACVTLARTHKESSTLIKPIDPVVPTLLRSLSPQYIIATPNQVTVEFHGGMDHYGYRVRQSETNAKQWTISWYTENDQRLLAAISSE